MNMAKFIPKAKMSKKAQKKLAKKNRVTWEVNPVTRKTENRKVYNRKRNSRERFDEPPAGVFLCCSFIEIARDVRLQVAVSGPASIRACVA